MSWTEAMRQALERSEITGRRYRVFGYKVHDPSGIMGCWWDYTFKVIRRTK